MSLKLALNNKLSDVIQRAYAKALQKNQLDAETMGLNYDKLWGGASKELKIKTDLGDVRNPQFALGVAMRDNIMSFVAFKNYHNVNELVAALTNPDGTARTFEQFKKVATEIQTDFNVRHLESEFRMCQAAGQSALQWQQQWQDRDLYPKLQYRTANDARVRASHRILEGVCYPIEAAFWDTMYPPNGFGCRCGVKQVSESVRDRAPKRPIKDTEIPEAFRCNAGKTGEIASQKHPYFQNMNPETRQLVINAASKFMFNKIDSETHHKQWLNDANYFVAPKSVTNSILIETALYVAKTGVNVEVFDNQIIATNGEVRKHVAFDDASDIHTINEALRQQPKLLISDFTNGKLSEKLYKDAVKGNQHKGVHGRSIWVLNEGHLKQF